MSCLDLDLYFIIIFQNYCFFYFSFLYDPYFLLDNSWPATTTTHAYTHKNRQDINIIHIIRKKNQLQPINFDVSHEEFHSFFGSIRTHYITSYITSPVITITWVRYYNYNFSLHSCHFNLILIYIKIMFKFKKQKLRLRLRRRKAEAYLSSILLRLNLANDNDNDNVGIKCCSQCQHKHKH